ncbi:transposase, partial [mine drainage metagenome]
AAAKDLSIVERARSILKVDLPVAQGFLALGLNQVVYRLPVSTRLTSWVRDSLLPQWEKWDVSNLSRRGFEGTLDALCSYTQGMRKLQAGLELQDELTRAWRGETREPAGFYYDFDTTKVRYYGTTQPYAEVGHASDRSIRRVVAFGLVTSRVHHHPVQLRPIMGSRSDFLSVDETVARLEGADVKGVTLVMDRGMVSAENIARVRKAGYHQIGMVRDGGDDWWEALGHWDEEALQRPENLVVRPSGERLYAQAWTGALLGQRQLRLALVVDPEEKELERLGRDEKVRELLGATGEGAGAGTSGRAGGAGPASEEKRTLHSGPAGEEPGAPRLPGGSGEGEGGDAPGRTAPAVQHGRGPLSGGDVSSVLREGRHREELQDGQGSALAGPDPLSERDPAGSVCHGALHGASALELGGAEAAEKIPPSDAGG